MPTIRRDRQHIVLPVEISSLVAMDMKFWSGQLIQRADVSTASIDPPVISSHTPGIGALVDPLSRSTIEDFFLFKCNFLLKHR
jgi:hypothetical protein